MSGLLAEPVSVSLILAAALAAIIMGLAKGGLTGLGALATPVLALAINPVQAAAALLPLMLVQDVISVWAFRKSWNRSIVAWMLPGALLGIATGWALAAVLPVSGIMAGLGVLAILFGVWRLWVERHGLPTVAASGDRALPRWPGIPFGWATGLTSQIAHAGGPPFQMWVVPMRLSPAEYAGTNAILFALINWAKVPAFWSLGQFRADTLILCAAMLPIATVATLVGVRVVHRLNGRVFYLIVNLLMIVVGIKLIADAVA